MTTSDRFEPGTRIGDYVIDRDLGFAYEAAHVLLPRRARLDVLQATSASSRVIAVRMMREACILEALHHPGVPRVYEVGMLADRRPWVASELVAGALLAEAPPVLPAGEVIALVRDVAEVLAHAHGRGVAHRNLSPYAISRCDGSRGFGVCVTQWSDARAHDGKEADRAYAADVFALGAIAYKLLAGSERRTAGARVMALVDDMLVADSLSRPTAAEICARARLIIDSVARGETEDSVSEERVVLVDISRTTTPRGQRWTPVAGVPVERPIPRGIAIGVLRK